MKLTSLGSIVALGCLLLSLAGSERTSLAQTLSDPPSVLAPAVRPSTSPNEGSQDSVATQQRFQAHAERGAQAFAAGAWDKAIEEYLAAYEVKPRVILLFNIAQAYRKSGRWQGALTYYERVAREDPNSPLEPESQAQATAMRAIIEADRLSAERERAEREATERAQEAQRLSQENILLQHKEREAQRSVQTLKKQRFYKKPWFWLVLGGTAVAVGVSVGLGVGLAPHEPQTEGGFFNVNPQALR